MQNFVTITGRMTKDAEIKRTDKGKQYSLFTVACQRDLATQSINSRTADFIQCQAWGTTAENLVKFAKKGTLVTIQGRLQSSRIATADGFSAYKTFILTSKAYFLQHSKKHEESLKKEIEASDPEPKKKHNPYDFENLDPFEEEEYFL